MNTQSILTTCRSGFFVKPTADASPTKRLLESHSSSWKVCAEATNGLCAVQKAEETSPDLVILDLEMPVMDGLSASLEIARLLPGVPILMNTFHKSEYVDREAKMAGVREVISKSDSRALLTAVEGLLGENSKKMRSIDNEAGT